MDVPGKLLRRGEFHAGRFRRWARHRLTLDVLADVLICAVIVGVLAALLMVPTLVLFVLGFAAGLAACAILWR